MSIPQAYETKLLTEPRKTAMSESRRVAWITGSGAPRVGQAIAGYFAKAGYDIALHAHTSQAEARAFAAEVNQQFGQPNVPRAIVTVGAVDDPQFATHAVAEIVSRFGRLDVLINSAAIWDGKPLELTTIEDLRQQFETNTAGTYLCSQAAGLQMTQQAQGGSIVLIGDWAVARPYRDFSAYFVGKGAIETMTRSLAVELATRNPNVRVNAIMPGPVLLDAAIHEERAETIRQQSLLKRHGSPEYVAHAAKFLAENEFITGVCLPVDGGRTIYSGDSFDAIAHPKYQREDLRHGDAKSTDRLED